MLPFICQLKATKNEMRPKQAFCVLKDVQQLLITHLDQETVYDEHLLKPGVSLNTLPQQVRYFKSS